MTQVRNKETGEIFTMIRIKKMSADSDLLVKNEEGVEVIVKSSEVEVIE